MDFWRDKVVLVTGGSSGLGLAIARAFATSGAKLVVAARGTEKLGQAAEQLAALGGEVLAAPCDVTNQKEVDTLFDRAISRFDRLDVLVNNAGRSARGEVLTTTPEDFAAMLELNLLALVRCTRAAAPYLLAQRGHVVNIGSLAAKSATRFMGAYPASKFAVAAYSQQLRLELAPQGLHVLLACPGPIRSDQTRDYLPADNRLPAAASRPGAGVKLPGLDPERVAAAIVRACERRQSELILPARARLLFTLAQMSPRLGDWVVKKMT